MIAFTSRHQPNMEQQPSSSRTHNSRLQRNMKERDRRMQMKHLLSELASVIHPQPLKASVPELLDHATIYVNHLHERIERLQKQKSFYETTSGVNNSAMPVSTCTRSTQRPTLDVRSWDSTVEVNLICGTDYKIMAHEIIRILQEEGAEVTSFASHNVGDTTIYTIMAQAIILRIGIETSRIRERLKELINSFIQ